MEKNNEMEDENKKKLANEDYFLEILKKKYGNEFELEIKDNKDFEPYIIVDKRENRSGIITELEGLGAIVVEETLDSGDYMLSSVVAAERKRGDDYYGSLFSGSNKTNIFDELVRLADAVENPILIIEDFQRMFKRGEDKISSLYGAMVSIATTLKIPIIPTRSIKDTALVLYRLAKQQQGDQSNRGIARRAPRTMSLKDRQMFFLEGFLNVGPTKAMSILEKFGTPLNFITALLNTEILYTKSGNPKGIEGDLKELKGLGWKFVKNNKSLLAEKEYTK